MPDQLFLPSTLERPGVLVNKLIFRTVNSLNIFAEYSTLDFVIITLSCCFYIYIYLLTIWQLAKLFICCYIVRVLILGSDIKLFLLHQVQEISKVNLPFFLSSFISFLYIFMNFFMSLCFLIFICVSLIDLLCFIYFVHLFYACNIHFIFIISQFIYLCSIKIY